MEKNVKDVSRIGGGSGRLMGTGRSAGKCLKNKRISYHVLVLEGIQYNSAQNFKLMRKVVHGTEKVNNFNLKERVVF